MAPKQLHLYQCKTHLSQEEPHCQALQRLFLIPQETGWKMHGSQAGFMSGVLRWFWVGGSNPKIHYREVRDWLFTHTHVPCSMYLMSFQGQQIMVTYFSKTQKELCRKYVHCQLQSQDSLGEDLKLLLFVMDNAGLFCRPVSILH